MPALRLSVQARIENEVLVHMLMRLASAPAEDQPFPHFFVEEVLPAHIYQQLLENLPPTEIMHPMGERHRNSDGVHNRYELPLGPEMFAQLSTEQAELWCGVHKALVAPQFKQAVFAKLSRGLSFRFGIPASEVNTIAGYPRCNLMRETEGYYIAPHPDTRKKLVTMQFALPRDRSQADLGTTFYERSMAPRDWISVPRGFRRAKQMPFLPNCCYGFAVINSLRLKSWHGREVMHGEQGTRNSILHVYYAEDNGSHRYEQ